MSNSLYNSLNFSWDVNQLDFPAIASEPKKPLFMLRKLMAEYVWDLVHVEDNPFTFIEVKTLLEGITIGGHQVLDESQVLNQHRALKLLMAVINEEGMEIGKDLALRFHKRVAFEEALKWGRFRDSGVKIGGTSHQPPPADQLNDLYDQGIEAIRSIQRPFEQALVYYFWGSMNQFFFDGNKRTSRAMMNFILLKAGYFYLSVPGRRKDEFNSAMVNFYDTKDATSGMRFLMSCYRSWD